MRTALAKSGAFPPPKLRRRNASHQASTAWYLPGSLSSASSRQSAIQQQLRHAGMPVQWLANLNFEPRVRAPRLVHQFRQVALQMQSESQEVRNDDHPAHSAGG